MTPGGKYSLVDIFSSLQGEGANAGTPATFIRLAGCNLACPWCDTDVNEKFKMSLDEIIARVAHYHNALVVVTGGEPSINPALAQLVKALHDCNKRVALETNGIRAPACADDFDYIAVSPKSEYESRYIDTVMLRKADEVRIVATGEEIAPFCRKMRELISARRYYISPLEKDGHIHYRRAVNLLLRLNRNRLSGMAAAAPSASMHSLYPPWSLSIQLHKVLGIK